MLKNTVLIILFVYISNIFCFTFNINQNNVGTTEIAPRTFETIEIPAVNNTLFSFSLSDTDPFNYQILQLETRFTLPIPLSNTNLLNLDFDLIWNCSTFKQAEPFIFFFWNSTWSSSYTVNLAPSCSNGAQTCVDGFFSVNCELEFSINGNNIDRSLAYIAPFFFPEDASQTSYRATSYTVLTLCPGEVFEIRWNIPNPHYRDRIYFWTSTEKNIEKEIPSDTIPENKLGTLYENIVISTRTQTADEYLNTPLQQGTLNYSMVNPGTYTLNMYNEWDYDLYAAHGSEFWPFPYYRIIVKTYDDATCQATSVAHLDSSINVICPDNCIHGTCVNDICECDPGFWYYDCSQGCAPETTLTEPFGFLTDGPTFADGFDINSISYADCSWIIEPPQQNFTSLIFQFNKLSLSPVAGDIVSIFGIDDNGTEVLVENYEEIGGLPRFALVPYPKAKVYFSTNRRYFGTGINITYVQAPCDPGSYLDPDFGCTKCDEGYFSPLPNSLTCEICTSGTFSTVGSQQCTTCPTSEYSNLTGASECLKCPPGSTTTFRGATQIKECLCSPNFFTTGNVTEGGVECFACREGAICNGRTQMNGSFINIEPRSIAGYWNSKQEPYNFLKCATIFECTGGEPEACAVGFEGTMCNVCIDGYYKRWTSCNPCEDGSGVSINILIFIAIIVSAVIYFVSNKSNFVRVKATLSITTSFGLLITFLQVLSVYRDFDIQFPEIVEDFFELLSVFSLNIDIGAPECSFGQLSSFTRYLLKVLAPLLFVIIFGLFYLISIVQEKFAQKYGSGFRERFPNFTKNPGLDATKFAEIKFFIANIFTEPQRMSPYKIANSLIMILDLIYVYMCEVTFEIYNCYENTDDTQSWWKDPELRCYSGEWFTLLPASMVAIFLYVILFPGLLFYVIWKGPSKQDDVIFMTTFAHVFYRFQPSKYYWEAILIVRKVLIAFVILVFADSAILQTTLSMLIIIVALVSELHHFPFYTAACNWLESFILATNFIILAFLILYIGPTNEDAFGENDSLRQSYGYIIISLVVLVIVITGSIFAVFTFQVFFPRSKQITSRHQESVLSTWRTIFNAKKVDFSKIWEGLPSSERKSTLIAAYAFGYEILRLKGSFKRVSPTALGTNYSTTFKNNSESSSSSSSASEDEDTGTSNSNSVTKRKNTKSYSVKLMEIGRNEYKDSSSNSKSVSGGSQSSSSSGSSGSSGSKSVSGGSQSSSNSSSKSSKNL